MTAPSVSDVIRATVTASGLAADDLVSRAPDFHLACWRQAAMVVARERCRMTYGGRCVPVSFARIGQRFDRSQKSAIHAQRQASRRSVAWRAQKIRSLLEARP